MSSSPSVSVEEFDVFKMRIFQNSESEVVSASKKCRHQYAVEAEPKKRPKKTIVIVRPRHPQVHPIRIHPIQPVQSQTTQAQIAQTNADHTTQRECNFQDILEEDVVTIDAIPTEIVVQIFWYLARKDLLLGVALVCKKWKLMSEACQLWRSINLYPVRANVTTEVLQRLLKLSTGIVHINLSSCSRLEDLVISEVAKQTKLRFLSLSRCNHFSSKIFEMLGNFKSLQWLNLYGLDILTDGALQTVAESCINLQKIDVSRCLRVTAVGLLSVIKHCTGMKIIALNDCNNVTDEFLIALATVPSQIEELAIRGCLFTADGLKYLRKVPKLAILWACRVYSLRDNSVSVLTNLTHLSLDCLTYVTNEGIVTICRNNPRLEVLSLSFCSIDDTALEIISKSPCRLTLRRLIVSYCAVSENGICLILQSSLKLKSLLVNEMRKETVEKWLIQYPNIQILPNTYYDNWFIKTSSE